MKLENFEEVKSIVNEIQANENELKFLEQPLVTIIINSNGEHGRVATIGAYPSCEHNYKKFAMEFIEKIKAEQKCRIEYLKRKLADL